MEEARAVGMEEEVRTHLLLHLDLSHKLLLYLTRPREGDLPWPCRPGEIRRVQYHTRRHCHVRCGLRGEGLVRERVEPILELGP